MKTFNLVPTVKILNISNKINSSDLGPLNMLKIVLLGMLLMIFVKIIDGYLDR